MNKSVLFAAMLLTASLSYAQDYSENVSIKRQIHNPTTTKTTSNDEVIVERDTNAPFVYVNKNWLPGITADMIPQKGINSLEVKKDYYDNDAVFYTVTTETYTALKKRSDALYPNPWKIKKYDVEFPGGKDKLNDWISKNQRIPEGIVGVERVTVRIKVNTDGTIADTKVTETSKNEEVNAEALRLANSLPNFDVKYYTPTRTQVNYYLSLKFKDPENTFVH